MNPMNIGGQWRIFKKITAMNFRVMLYYKWSFLFTLFIVPVQMLVNILLFRTIFNHNGSDLILGYDVSQMVWYYVGVGFVFQIIWNFTDSNISNKILSGDLVVDLLRPLSIYTIELAHAVALRMAGIIFEFLPGVILYSLIYFPHFLTALSFLKFLSVAILSFLLFFSLNFLVGNLAFFTKSNKAFTSIKDLIFYFFGGCMIPLEFLPHSIQKVLHWLPFEYIFYWPIQFFLNRESAAGLETWLRILSIQAFWIIFFLLLGRISHKFSIKRFCAVG